MIYRFSFNMALFLSSIHGVHESQMPRTGTTCICHLCEEGRLFSEEELRDYYWSAGGT